MRSDRDPRVINRHGWGRPWRLACLAQIAVALWTAAPLHAQPPAADQDLAHPQGTNAGIFAFTGRCASCHDTGKGGATDRYALNRHTPEEVLSSITTGKMAQYAQGLTEYEKRVVAVYVGGRPLGAAAQGDAAQMKNRCETPAAFAPAPASDWNGWGIDRGNSRFQEIGRAHV